MCRGTITYNNNYQYRGGCIGSPNMSLVAVSSVAAGTTSPSIIPHSIRRRLRRSPAHHPPSKPTTTITVNIPESGVPFHLAQRNPEMSPPSDTVTFFIDCISFTLAAFCTIKQNAQQMTKIVLQRNKKFSLSHSIHCHVDNIIPIFR